MAGILKINHNERIKGAYVSKAGIFRHFFENGPLKVFALMVGGNRAYYLVMVLYWGKI